MVFRTVLIVFLILVAGCGVHRHAQTAAGASDAVEGRGADTEKWWDKLPRPQWSAYERVLADEAWFEVYRVGADVYAVYEPGQFEEVISFLIVGTERALLFDTGLGLRPIRPVVEKLTSLPVTVVNSHSHYDHVGGNHEFDAIASLDIPYTNENAGGYGADVVGEFVRGDWLAVSPRSGFDPGAYRILPWERQRIIDDGDIIDLGGRRLEVIWTPGHAPDALCLLDRAARRLYVGDTFYLAPLYAHLEGSDFEAYRTSVARLARLQRDVDTLMTAHNVPVADSRYLLRLEEAFDKIAAGTAPYIVTDGAREYGFDGFSVITAPPGTRP